jgi:hypothetical protein
METLHQEEEMITIKIDVTKIQKDLLFIGKAKPDGSQPKYLDCILFENRDGVGKYGDTHFIVQGVSKAAREAGQKGPIIGNATIEIQEQPPRRTTNKIPRAQPQIEEPGTEDDAIPF